MRGAAALELENVTRTFGTKVAVAQLSLQVQVGELFAFLGPNGAGKTTTIKMICGLLRPNQGTLRVCGYDALRQPELARAALSYVPDNPYLYEKLTGREFFQLVLDLYNISPTEGKRRLDYLIQIFDLSNYLDDLTETYSHGMKQRVAFAAALLHGAPVLIVDEPTLGLDPFAMRALKNLLRQYTRQGATVFLSTHSLDLVEALADRIGIIAQGRLIAVGTLEELRRRTHCTGSLEEVFLQLIEGALHQQGHGTPCRS
ncbi:MAG: ABC transporter ATP-binding protein [Gemmatales bacterium]|nr:ABC transporter ATP-binding protein [Gemmatales bacterium]MDW7994111.1 ABC transporter ATP-binding protein [Gemmatales bacterium]